MNKFFSVNKFLITSLCLMLCGCEFKFTGTNKPQIDVPVSTVSEPVSADLFDINAEGPPNASPSDIIIYDASKSNADSITWSAFIVSTNATQIKLIPIENNTKVIVPPEIGEIYITVAGCKDKVVKLKTYRTVVSDKGGKKPDVIVKPDNVTPVPIESEFTKFIKSELAKVASPDKAIEKNILKQNILTTLDANHTDPVDFTADLRRLNIETVTSSMKSKWNDFMLAIKAKMESLNLETMDQHTKIYRDFVKGLE